RVVRMTSTARRVQQDGDVSRRQHLEYGAEFAGVNRTTVHVAVDLDRAQAELPGGAFDFVARVIRFVHRHGGSGAGEPVWIFRDELCQLVVRDPRKLDAGVRRDVLGRRTGGGEDLPVVLEPVHPPEAWVKAGQPFVVRRLLSRAHELQVGWAAGGEVR